MRTTLATLTIGLLTLTTLTTNVRADDLFSTSSLGSPFAGAKPVSGGDRASSAASSDRGVRVLSLDQLAEILTDAGLAPKKDTDNLVSIKFQHSRWTFPVAFTMTDDNSNIWMTMLLVKLEPEQILANEQLLGLLGTNRDIRPAFFTLSDSGKRIEMFLQITNTAITPKALRDNLAVLAGVAENSATLWDLAPVAGKGQPNQPPATAQVGPPQIAPPQNAQPVSPVANQTAPVANQTPQNGGNPAAQAAPAVANNPASSALAGKWLATISEKEALAALLNADGTYTIVHVKDGKQTKSNGNYAFTGGVLSFTASNGDKLGGNISAITEGSFDYTPNTGTKLTFKRSK